MNSQLRSTGENKSARRFITLTRQDPEFEKYLAGHGPDGFHIHPVESFAVNSARERVTFVLEPMTWSARPARWSSWARVARLELLSLTLGPVLVTVSAVANWRTDVAWWNVAWMVLAVMALHVSAFAQNDYDDHRQGIDRIQRRRGSQVIQRGWMTATEVRWLSRGALLAGLAFGLPVLWRSDVAVGLLAMIALGAVVGFSFSGRGFKYQGVGDAVVGLCMGPLLSLGVMQVLAPEAGLWGLLLGLPLGLAAVIVFQLRQLETILSERSVRSGTLVARLGFDRSKAWIQGELWLLPLATALAVWPWSSRWTLILLVVAIFICLAPLSFRLRRAASPLSSHLVNLARQALYLHLVLTAILMMVLGRSA